jgi:hypothetical protein
MILGSTIEDLFTDQVRQSRFGRGPRPWEKVRNPNNLVGATSEELPSEERQWLIFAIGIKSIPVKTAFHLKIKCLLSSFFILFSLTALMSIDKLFWPFRSHMLPKTRERAPIEFQITRMYMAFYFLFLFRMFYDPVTTNLQVLTQ